jgi:hypothetical protein
MALPFVTSLAIYRNSEIEMFAPSKRFYDGKSRAPKTLIDWARQAALQIHRWLPDRSIVLVADSAFAPIEFLAAVRTHVCVVTRLRLDANLFGFPKRLKGRWRPPSQGKRLEKLGAILKDRKLRWRRHQISLWYGQTNRIVKMTSGVALWYRGGVPPVPSRPWHCWNGSQAYAAPKLHDVLLAFGVARRWPDVLSNALTPGRWVPTRIGGPGAPDELDQAHLTQAWLATSDDPKAISTGRSSHHQRSGRARLGAQDLGRARPGAAGTPAR